jgi:23S rRNA pseudouridine1911/1915/1917 synthase
VNPEFPRRVPCSGKTPAPPAARSPAPDDAARPVPDAPDVFPPETPPLELRVSGSERIDRLLARELPFSRTRVRALLEAGRVTVDGHVLRRASALPPEGSQIRVHLPPPEPTGLAADPLPLEVLHEDSAILVLNKPAGLVVHPAPGHPRGTLVNALVARGTLSGEIGERPGIVHRLDKDTSGVIVVAKGERAHGALAAQFKSREIRKLYEAVAWGHLPGDRGAVERPIGRSRSDRQKMAIDLRRGRPALTRWRRIARFAVAEHLEIDLASGRTHQIRVHLASLGHPLVGDTRYGGGRGVETGFQGPQRALVRGALAAIGRVALHARSLELVHPLSGERLVFEAPLPPDFRRLLEFLR